MNLHDAFLMCNLSKWKRYMLVIHLEVVLILLKILLQIIKEHLMQKVGAVEYFLFPSCAYLQEFGFGLLPVLKCDPKKLFSYCSNFGAFKNNYISFLLRGDFRNNCICTLSQRHAYHIGNILFYSLIVKEGICLFPAFGGIQCILDSSSTQFLQGQQFHDAECFQTSRCLFRNYFLSGLRRLKDAQTIS